MNVIQAFVILTFLLSKNAVFYCRCANGYNYEVTKTEEICQCTVDDFDW